MGVEVDILLYTQIITGVLFLASEILGASKCQYNGVFEVIFKGFGCCLGGTVTYTPKIRDPVVAAV